MGSKFASQAQSPFISGTKNWFSSVFRWIVGSGRRVTDRHKEKSSCEPVRALFEELEPRILLSADLLPVASVPAINPTLTRADTATVPVIVSNMGDKAVSSPVVVKLYASQNAKLDASDTLIGKVT